MLHRFANLSSRFASSSYHYSVNRVKFFSSSIKNFDASQDHTVVAGNGVIVAYHPDHPFPYEHTRPIHAEESLSKNSPLNESLHEKSGVDHFKSKKSLHVGDYQNMFYADKKTFGLKYRIKRIDSTVQPTPTPRRGL